MPVTVDRSTADHTLLLHAFGAEAVLATRWPDPERRALGAQRLAMAWAEQFEAAP